MNVPAMSQEEKIYKFLSVTNGFEKTDDINEAIANYSPTDEKRICRFVGANGEHCFKQNCRMEHKVITKGELIYIFCFFARLLVLKSVFKSVFCIFFAIF